LFVTQDFPMNFQIQDVPSETHEAVYRWENQALGVIGFVAIHSTVLGPAFGGARLWAYDSEAEALTDALRLSEGMSYKNALADLGAGGGKSVLWARQPLTDRDEVFACFGKVIELLRGRYITAEDVGTSVADMQIVQQQTRFVAGLPAIEGKAGGDPSPWTALGVMSALEAALAADGQTVRGLTVAVQGLGSVGHKLCGLLHASGAKLIVADRFVGRAEQVAEEFGATTCGPEFVLATPADILAPCALGGILNDRTIPLIKARYIVGAANNQLGSPADGHALARRGIIYVPDYVANAGGIINAMAEYRGDDDQAVEQDVRHIGARVEALLKQARLIDEPPFKVAQRIAVDLIGAAAKQRSPA
jgi:leucine dehydrogenase